MNIFKTVPIGIGLLPVDMAGTQFKRNNSSYDFQLNYGEENAEEDTVRTGDSNILRFAALERIRMDVVRQKDGLFLPDAWQRMCCKKCQPEAPGVDMPSLFSFENLPRQGAAVIF